MKSSPDQRVAWPPLFETNMPSSSWTPSLPSSLPTAPFPPLSGHLTTLSTFPAVLTMHPHTPSPLPKRLPFVVNRLITFVSQQAAQEVSWSVLLSFCFSSIQSQFKGEKKEPPASKRNVHFTLKPVSVFLFIELLAALCMVPWLKPIKTQVVPEVDPQNWVEEPIWTELLTKIKAAAKMEALKEAEMSFYSEAQTEISVLRGADVALWVPLTWSNPRNNNNDEKYPEQAQWNMGRCFELSINSEKQNNILWVCSLQQSHY